mgnify:FL=1
MAKAVGTVKKPMNRPSIMPPAFRGVAAPSGLEGPVSPRGFVIVGKKHGSQKCPNVFNIEVGVAMAPLRSTPPVATKTHFSFSASTGS